MTRGFPDVGGVRVWHQIARYLYSDQGDDEEEHGLTSMGIHIPIR